MNCTVCGFPIYQDLYEDRYERPFHQICVEGINDTASIAPLVPTTPPLPNPTTSARSTRTKDWSKLDLVRFISTRTDLSLSKSFEWLRGDINNIDRWVKESRRDQPPSTSVIDTREWKKEDLVRWLAEETDISQSKVLEWFKGDPSTLTRWMKEARESIER